VQTKRALNALACVDQGYTGAQPAQDVTAHGMQLEVVKIPEAKKGFVLLPRRRVELMMPSA
jgi:hypothetical protein